MRSIIASLRIICCIILFISIVDASEINYNMDDIPLFDYNNSTLIETIYGYYGLDEELLLGGPIIDIQNDNIDFDYSMVGEYENNSSRIESLGINNSKFTFNKSTINLNVNYSTSENVKSIVPFSFNLNKWPETFLSVNIFDNIETNYRGPFALIGDSKVLVFPLLPKPYFYNIQTINDSSTVSVVANPSIKHDNLEIELTFLILEEVNELFANEKTFSSQHSLKPPTEPRMFPFSDVTIQSENETITTNFHNLTPGDLSNWNFTDSSSMMVINGILMTDYTSDILNRFLIGENATLEPIALEEASKLNKSDWIYDGKLFYRIVKLKTEYIEDIIVELKGTLNNFQTGEFFSTVQIKIEVNESAITQKYTDDKTVLSNLTLNYNEKSTIVKYDYEENEYLFTDDIVLIGKSYLYPLDYYTSSIEVTGGELIQKHQQFESQDSGFNLDVDFSNNNITIKKSRTILPRYFLSIIVLIIVGYILNKFYIRKKRHQFASKDIVELSFFVLAALGSTLYLAFDNYNYVYSLGIVPFLVFILFIIFSFYKNNK